MTTRSFSRRALRVLMVVSVLAGIAQIVAYTALQADWEPGSVLRAAPYGAIAAAIAVCMSLLVTNDRRGNVRAARMIARSLVALTLSAFFYDVMFVEDTPLSSVFVFQFVLVVAYQMSNDPNLDRHNPRDGGFRGAIPLSFFNLFWIFVICSVFGLFGETIVSFFRDGRWESRAGFVIGPFSPIYGMGAVLITAALNRIYDRNPFTIVLVGGVVGAAFEYFAGWFFESAFGIVAWSYEGQPLNFHGHTSVLQALVWGLIGLAWMKIALPRAMKLIDLIPLRARVPVTLLGTVILLADAILTVLCLDCWFLRMSGEPIQTPWQELCARYFDDEFMQRRFETMSMWTILADR